MAQRPDPIHTQCEILTQVRRGGMSPLSRQQGRPHAHLFCMSGVHTAPHSAKQISKAGKSFDPEIEQLLRNHKHMLSGVKDVKVQKSARERTKGWATVPGGLPPREFWRLPPGVLPMDRCPPLAGGREP